MILDSVNETPFDENDLIQLKNIVMIDEDENSETIKNNSLSYLWSFDQLNPYVTLQNPISLSSLCSACFNYDSTSNDVYISFDDNFQQKRFLTSKNADDAYREHKNRWFFINNDDLYKEDVHFFSCLLTKRSWKQIRLWASVRIILRQLKRFIFSTRLSILA